MATEPPGGEVRADIRTGHQTALLLNAFAGKKGATIKVKDVTLSFDGKDDGKLRSSESQLDYLKAFTIAMGGKVKE